MALLLRRLMARDDRLWRWFALFMLVASRRLELNILYTHGLTSHLHYAKYIAPPDEDGEGQKSKSKRRGRKRGPKGPQP